MNIAVGSDHAGVELKKAVVSWLEQNGYEVNDMGPYSEASVDYPDYARKVANAVAEGICDQGILLCGTGIGVSIAANKVKGIRAALCCNPEFATLAGSIIMPILSVYQHAFLLKSSLKPLFKTGLLLILKEEGMN